MFAWQEGTPSLKEIVSSLKSGKGICPVCSALVGNLQRHVPTHMTLKPFICRECGKGYCSKTALDVHVKNSHTVSYPALQWPTTQPEETIEQGAHSLN